MEDKALESAFKRAGIDASHYVRHPEGEDSALVNLNPSRNKLWYFLGESTLVENISYSTKHRQVTFTFREPGRRLKRTIDLVGNEHTPRRYSARSVFPVALPRNATYRVIKQTVGNRRKGDLVYPNDWKVEIEATVPKSSIHFLVGYDEDHLFVSMLPKQATSVENAHEILLPKNVGKDAKRQGEFFFVPVKSKALIERANEEARTVPRTNTNWRGAALLKDHNISHGHYSEHDNSVGRVRNYVCGIIWHPRHKPLNLDGWHEVITNNEIEAPATARSWD